MVNIPSQSSRRILVSDHRKVTNAYNAHRLFPFGVTVGSLTILFIVILAFLSTNDSLTPGICMVFSFILFTLFLTGLIETGIQLFGTGNVSNNCQNYVFNNKVTGLNVNTLAWLQQNNICESYSQTIKHTLNSYSTGQSWYAAFAFWLVGTLLFVGMMFFSLQIGSGALD